MFVDDDDVCKLARFSELDEIESKICEPRLILELVGNNSFSSLQNWSKRELDLERLSTTVSPLERFYTRRR